MDFIHERIKEKPMNKKRLVMKIGMAVLCGFVFALTVCIALLLLLPRIKQKVEEERNVPLDISEVPITSKEENTEKGTEEFILPPDFSLSVSDYQTLQNELYEIGNEVNKSIVTVGRGTDWMENFYETAGQRAGTIIAEDDAYLYILTEGNGIADEENIRVTFVDGAGADAEILKQDSNTGIMVLTVARSQLTRETKQSIAIAKLGSSYEVENGAVVIALGSPLGTNYSIFTGNITSIDNMFTTQDKNYRVYTTDIIGNGNSSGILVNIRGEMIGLVIQSFCGSQEGGTLTAVPITELAELAKQLREGKDIPYIGLYISTVTEDISKEHDIPTGVYIKDVAADSPAMRAGLQSGDVITHLNGEKVNTDMDYSEKVSQMVPGTICEISVKRQNGDKYYDVTSVVFIGVF